MEFTAGNIQALVPAGAWRQYQRTTPVQAVRINEPCTVYTRTGRYDVTDPAGTWIALDVNGYPYPIDPAEFAASYALASGEPPESLPLVTSLSEDTPPAPAP